MDSRIDLVRKGYRNQTDSNRRLPEPAGCPDSSSPSQANGTRAYRPAGLRRDHLPLYQREPAATELLRPKETTEFLKQPTGRCEALSLDEQDASTGQVSAHVIWASCQGEESNEYQHADDQLNTQLDAATQAISPAWNRDKSYAESMLSAQQASRNSAYADGEHCERGAPGPAVTELPGNSQTQEADLKTRYTDDYPDLVVSTAKDQRSLRAQDRQGACSTVSHGV